MKKLFLALLATATLATPTYASDADEVRKWVDIFTPLINPLINPPNQGGGNYNPPNQGYHPPNQGYGISQVRPRLGFNCRTNGSNGGVYITSVNRGGTAEQIGLRPGMIIIEVDGRPVGTPDQFTRQLVEASRRARSSGNDQEVVLSVVNESQTAVNEAAFFIDDRGGCYGTTLRNSRDHSGGRSGGGDLRSLPRGGRLN